MDIEVYTFEDADGDAFGSWTTQDISEARHYAIRHRLRIIANVYEWTDSELVEDYTEKDENNPDEWDAPTCLRWLHEHTGDPNYLRRSEDWEGEVERFASYEDCDPDEWEAEATEELRQAVRDHLAKE